MQFNSIKFWLLLVINSIIFVSLSITAYISYNNALHELDEIYDAQLARNARLVSALLHNISFDDTELPIIIAVPNIIDSGENQTAAQQRQYSGHKYERKLAFQVWQHDNLLMESENTLSFPPLVKNEGFHELFYQDELWISFVLYLPEQDTWVVTAQREDVREEMSGHLALAQIRPILVLLLPLSMLIYIVIKWVLLPLKQLARLVAAKSPEQLTEITLAQPAELQPIKLAINQLIHRVAHHLQQEKRFTADAAHELRTPLSILQLHCANLLDAKTPEEINEAAASILLGSKKMTHLVNQLLQLSRVERIADTACGNTPLSQLLNNSLAALPLTLLESTEWQLTVDPALHIYGEPFLLSIVFKNLLENAAKYAEPEQQVSVTAAKNDDNALVISIINPSQIKPDVNRMGERFYRDPKHQSINGSGLGLSIVMRIVELHHANISYQLAADTFNVTLTFPHKECSTTV
ncbi:ATP-binding protein [Rheinheimera sp. UJ63]|uniref:ATP-binding protein n=1 Tax=Rheinheimera sp. UJ63 TaxID=2910157 RepID=UPI001F40BA67|nr:ATP-binding protein [Rheinheimera sp. UJ63]MCF4010034.1 ATP-binding protein [Rheinheimera sp. UJ63]